MDCTTLKIEMTDNTKPKVLNLGKKHGSFIIIIDSIDTSGASAIFNVSMGHHGNVISRNSHAKSSNNQSVNLNTIDNKLNLIHSSDISDEIVNYQVKIIS